MMLYANEKAVILRRKLLRLTPCAFNCKTIDLRKGRRDERVGGNGEEMDDGICHAIISNCGGIEEETDPDQFAFAEYLDDGGADI